MAERTINILILTLVLLTFSGEALSLSVLAEVAVYPDSPFADCNDDYLLKEVEPYLPAPTFCLALVSLSTLPNQGFVKSIFHPPTSIL